MSVIVRPLIALSLTPPDVELLRYAAMMPALDRCNALDFVHVVTDSAHASPAQADAALRDRMQSEIAAHWGTLRAPEHYEIRRGPRLDGLLSAAVQNQNDLILLGHRHDRSGRRSLARRLAMVSPCSIWMAPEGCPPRLNRILVPVDFSTPSADALSFAAALAVASGIERCIALHVFIDPSSIRYEEHVEEVKGQDRGAFDRFLEKVDRHGVEIEPAFEDSSHPVQAILRVAQRHEVDLIVMSTRGRSRAAAVLLGSITSKVMAASPLPVLAVKRHDTRMNVMQALLNHRFWEDQTPRAN